MSALAEEELEPAAGRWLRLGGGALLIVVVVGLTVYLLKGLSNSGPVSQKQVTKITVLPDTPPPPPPPKEEPKETKEVKLEQPKPVELPQEAEILKMEGAAGEGDSPFTAGAVSRDYSGGAAGGGLGFAFYTNALQRHLQDGLAKNKKLRGADYRTVVRVWIGRDGVIQRVAISGSSGNTEIDEVLRTALTGITAFREPPDNMPQPIKVRVSNQRG